VCLLFCNRFQLSTNKKNTTHEGCSEAISNIPKYIN
jgi:hypothetical protein